MHGLHGGLLFCDRQHLCDGEPVRGGLLLPLGRHEHDGGRVPQGLLLPCGLQRANALPCGHVWEHNGPHSCHMHGHVRGGLLHGDGQHIGDGQPLQRRHLLPCKRGVSRRHCLHAGCVLPRWNGHCGCTLPLWLLHVRQQRNLLHCVHGGLLLRHQQHFCDGEPVRSGLVLSRGRH